MKKNNLLVKVFTALCLMVLGTALWTPVVEAAVVKPSPDETIVLLKAGNERFVQGQSLHPNTDAARFYQAGTENQGDHAYATVITCSDSRVPVERLFDAGVMDIFVIRVAGNVCDTDEVGSIEYGLAHVNTPVLVVLGHKQCGAVTAVTHAILGTGHALERNIPPLVDNIEPAVRRAMANHADVHGDAIIPYGIVENVWQGIEDLFLKSPSTRNLVNSGKVKVVGAIYDVGTGQIEWLPESRTGQILAKVESNPSRAMNAMAGTGHGGGHSAPAQSHGAAAGAGHAVASASHGAAAGHTEVKAVPVNLADAETLGILRADWLKEASETALTETLIPLSNTFWALIALVGVFSVVALLSSFGGAFKRAGLSLKLYTSHGVLALLAVLLGLTGYMYITQVASVGELEAAYLEIDMMTGEVYAAQNNFLLHGIENRKYGETQVAAIQTELKEFEECIAAIEENSFCTDEDVRQNEAVREDLREYGAKLEEVVAAYHEIEENKETLDEIGESTEEILEEMNEHHTEQLAELEAEGVDSVGIAYQTTVVAHLDAMEIHLLKATHAEVEFLLDKQVTNIETAESELGLTLGYLGALEEELNDSKEKARLAKMEEGLAEYVKEFKAVIRDEAVLEKDTSEMVGLLHDIKTKAAALSHEAKLRVAGMEREAEIASIIMVILAVVAGALLSILISRAITKSITNVIRGLTQGAEQVTSASDQVAQSSTQMAQGASEQASSLEEISASLEEMTSMTQQNAANSGQANSMSTEASNAAQKGLQAMAGMSEQISKIKSSSDETAKIIKTIDEIAFQTNLLALNAAVEAARAGDAGKGFAVVAEEVRNLAQRSAEAAKNTAVLIDESQLNAENGVKASKEVAELLSQISESSQKVTQLIGEVTEASNEQAQGIDQVNTAVAQLDQVTQGNAASSEEAAAASEELSAQSRELDEMVGTLVTIVGGHGNGSTNGHRVSLVPQNGTRRARLATAQATATPATINASHTKAVALIHAEQPVIAGPDQVIPVSQEELSKF